jgi:hypothetical protein
MCLNASMASTEVRVPASGLPRVGASSQSDRWTHIDDTIISIAMTVWTLRAHGGTYCKMLDIVFEGYDSHRQAKCHTKSRYNSNRGSHALHAVWCTLHMHVMYFELGFPLRRSMLFSFTDQRPPGSSCQSDKACEIDCRLQVHHRISLLQQAAHLQTVAWPRTSA